MFTEIFSMKIAVRIIIMTGFVILADLPKTGVAQIAGKTTNGQNLPGNNRFVNRC